MRRGMFLLFRGEILCRSIRFMSSEPSSLPASSPPRGRPLSLGAEGAFTNRTGPPDDNTELVSLFWPRYHNAPGKHTFFFPAHARKNPSRARKMRGRYSKFLIDTALAVW